ncbi:hypothetical protein BGZ50_008169, partial [Haplosporangium sp. Z 11]
MQNIKHVEGKRADDLELKQHKIDCGHKEAIMRIQADKKVQSERIELKKEKFKVDKKKMKMDKQ